MSTTSSEEDGDAEWRAAIKSVSSNVRNGGGLAPKIPDSSQTVEDGGDPEKKSEPRPLKLYQIKAQKLLDEIIEQNLEIVSNCNTSSRRSPESSEVETGIQLFRKAPPGIIFDPIDVFALPRKRQRILPSDEINEKSKQFRRRLCSATVDGADLMAAARDSCQKSLARFETKGVAAKLKAEREEERVSELKRIRGEKWLPAIARDMKVGRKPFLKGKAAGIVL